MNADEQLQDLREAVTLLAIAALEPSRFTFDVNLMAAGFDGEERSAALLVLVGLLEAAEGEEPHRWGPDARPFLRRFDQHAGNLQGVRLARAVEVFAEALQVHPSLAKRLLDAHMNDGKGLSAHQVLRG